MNASIESSAVDRRLEGDSVLRQCQLTELYLLDIFVEICERHSLRYFLGGGTLLGAMRHRGFIPWDDDLDVGMPIKDYRRFLKIAAAELPPQVMLCAPGRVRGMREGFAKLRDRSSFFCEIDTMVQAPCGIYLDIFPFIRFPVLPRRLADAIHTWGFRFWWASEDDKNRPRRFAVAMIRDAVMSMFWRSCYHLLRGVVKLLALVRPTLWHDDLSTPPYGSGPFQLTDAQLFPLKKAEFEGKEYCVPNDSNAALESHYGNWRELPPPEQRHTHSTIICPAMPPAAWWSRPYAGKDSKSPNKANNPQDRKTS